MRGTVDFYQNRRTQFNASDLDNEGMTRLFIDNFANGCPIVFPLCGSEKSYGVGTQDEIRLLMKVPHFRQNFVKVCQVVFRELEMGSDEKSTYEQDYLNMQNFLKKALTRNIDGLSRLIKSVKLFSESNLWEAEDEEHRNILLYTYGTLSMMIGVAMEKAVGDEKDQELFITKMTELIREKFYFEEKLEKFRKTMPSLTPGWGKKEEGEKKVKASSDRKEEAAISTALTPSSEAAERNMKKITLATQNIVFQYQIDEVMKKLKELTPGELYQLHQLCNGARACDIDLRGVLGPRLRNLGLIDDRNEVFEEIKGIINCAIDVNPEKDVNQGFIREKLSTIES